MRAIPSGGSVESSLILTLAILLPLTDVTAALISSLSISSKWPSSTSKLTLYVDK